MENVLFAGIAMVILVPIIYFLPLGFSLRGKVYIVTASLLIATVGLLAAPIMPLWQTLLIEVLLIGITAYFMFKRIETILQAPSDGMEQETYQQLEESRFESLNDTYNHIALSENWASELIEEEPGLLKKAMRQAGEPKFSILIGNKKENASVQTDDMPMNAIAEVAAGKEEASIEVVSQDAESNPDGDLEDLSHEFLVDNESEIEQETIEPDALPQVDQDGTRNNVQYIEQNPDTDISYLAKMEDLLIIEEEELPQAPTALQEASEDLEELDFGDEAAVSYIEEPTPSLSDYASDELPELEFDDIPLEKETPESQLDEEFWSSLLEEDELEVLDEKKEYSSVK
ncbi:hypothetical protein [Bacillus sp. FJAT-27251]|uniref:hypothetical protein n=1 Tax=Bacillus sp. FJAT-27251 TaxID=1684142 RepID=UPI0006A7B153|nr:hypothetical protein [Bacillus sp. FJAT-27251]